MRYAILALVSLTLGGCGRLDLGEFAPYVQRFEAEGQARGWDVQVTNLVVKLGDLPDGMYGICHHGLTPEIEVSRAYWPGATEEQREILLFHELGHCILEREHGGEAGRLDDRPSSLMAKGMVQDWAWKTYRTEYLDELF